MDQIGTGSKTDLTNAVAATATLPSSDCPTTSSPLRYSVVVPVFNEAANIAAFCLRALAELPPGYELLICYDMPEDTTIPALEALPVAEKPERIRLIHNQLGRGVRFAIEAGFRAATAPLVLVSMVDLSDDLGRVGQMLEQAEQGAAVVCGSRYMRGGRQIGGPWLKSLMSRTAGLTLCWFAGLPTHDATNSFKVYRRDFLERQTIESQAGFSLGMELTVKAHFQGYHVTEVPTTWLDRTAGESRFQLWKWLPSYLQWYLFAFKSHWSKSAPLASTLISVVLASIAAMLVMIGVYRLPQSDPVDVVGLPLMEGFDGYSESAERNAFHALVVAAVAFGLLFGPAMRRLPRVLLLPAGFMVFCLLLYLFLLYEPFYWNILQIFIVMICVTIFGRLVSRTGFDVRGQMPIDARFVAWLVPVTILPAVFYSGWFALWLALACVGIAWGERRLRPRFSYALSLAGILTLACWPDSPLNESRKSIPLDTFHDGQTLSGIWELEHGRQLISQVFPLRSTEVYLGWLARRILGPTSLAVDCSGMFGLPMLVSGACLMGYAWTRSPVWSVLCGLAALSGMTTQAGGTREGIMLLTMAIGLEILRGRDPRWWLLLIPVSVVPLLAGYDIAVPYLAGVGAALVFGSSLRLNFTAIIHGFARTITIVGLSVALFSAGIAILSGIEAAYDFWKLLFDYSRYLNAFYGLPIGIRWYTNLWARNSLIGLACFAAGGVVLWDRMRPRRRRQWAFLLVATMLYLHRGLGRSDDGHIFSAAIPIIVLWFIITFETLQGIARERWQLSTNQIHVFALCAVVVLAWQAPLHPNNVFKFFSKLREFPTQETILHKPDPVLSTIVSPQEFLWSADYGIANIEQQRHNPTRHALSFCIASPSEQRRAMRDLERNPTPLIIWYWINAENIDGALRQWILTTQVLRKYRPNETKLPSIPLPTIVRADSDWTGMDNVPNEFLKPLMLQRLPYIWGDQRYPRLLPRVVNSRDLSSWEYVQTLITFPVPSDRSPQVIYRYDDFVIKDEIIPRKWNYLQLELTMTDSPVQLNSWHSVCLQFQDNDKISDDYQVLWDCPADGKSHQYLIPIGCYPGWTWQSCIHKLRLRAQHGQIAVSKPARLCEIDELREQD